MKKSVDYQEVSISFIVTRREARRCAPSAKRLAEMLGEAVIGNGANGLDAEEIRVTINGKAFRLS